MNFIDNVNKYQHNFYNITHRLYQGGKPLPIVLSLMEEDKDSKWLIVSLIPDDYPDVSYLNRLVMPIDDNKFPSMPWLERVITTMKLFYDDGYSIYVHCHMGISRSAMVMIAYLMKYHYLILNKAMDMVGAANPSIFPNNSFMTGLKAFDKMCIASRKGVAT